LLSRQPHGLTQLGLYNAADKWKTALLFLPTMLFQVILPMLSQSQTKKDYRACRRIVFATFASSVGVTGLGAIVVFFLANPLMSSYGSAFVKGANVLSLAASVAVVGGIYTVGSGALWALGRPTQMLRIDVSKTALLLALCWVGFASSAWTLMFAYLLSFSAGCVLLIFALYRQLQCPNV
jgi:O-antigen/teichoic acid export membrane protein